MKCKLLSGETVSLEEVEARDLAFLEKILPSFNLLSYDRLGYGVARILISLLYKMSVGFEARAALDAMPRDSVVTPDEPPLILTLSLQRG